MSELDLLRAGLADLAEHAESDGDMYERALATSHQLARRRRRSSLAGSALAAACLVAVAALVAHYGFSGGPTGFAPVAVSATPVPSTDADASVARSASGQAPSGLRSATFNGAGCPVSAARLVAALKASDGNIYQRSGRPTALQKASCYHGYAVAQTLADGHSQQSWILFRFDGTTMTWLPLNVGSADYCRGYVPAAILGHLPGC